MAVSLTTAYFVFLFFCVDVRIWEICHPEAFSNQHVVTDCQNTSERLWTTSVAYWLLVLSIKQEKRFFFFFFLSPLWTIFAWPFFMKDKIVSDLIVEINLTLLSDMFRCLLNALTFSWPALTTCSDVSRTRLLVDIWSSCQRRCLLTECTW